MPPRLRRSLSLLALTLWAPGCVFVTGELNPFTSRPKPLEEHVVSGEGRTKILLIEVADVITGSDQRGPFGVTRDEATTARVFQQLEQARQDDAVRAILVRINSPGGGVTASDIVFHQLRTFHTEKDVPIVAQLLDVATSGGYYVALAADEIVASPTTVTGSVGVVMYGLNFAGLMQKLGVADQTIKTGAEKDIGSPFRAMTPEDHRLLQALLQPMQARFISLVRERRPQVSDQVLTTIADGRPVSATDALRDGLVDRIGYLDDTVRNVRTRIGDSDARVVMYRRPQEFAENLYSRGLPVTPQVNLVNVDVGTLAQPPQFMYLWLPPTP